MYLAVERLSAQAGRRLSQCEQCRCCSDAPLLSLYTTTAKKGGSEAKNTPMTTGSLASRHRRENLVPHKWVAHMLQGRAQEVTNEHHAALMRTTRCCVFTRCVYLQNSPIYKEKGFWDAGIFLITILGVTAGQNLLQGLAAYSCKQYIYCKLCRITN